MFSILLPVILLSLTSCSFASKNCSKTYTVNKYKYQNYEHKEDTEEVVCFRVDSGRVRLRFGFAMCDWDDFHDKPYGYDHNYYDSLQVYDGCNTTENELMGEKVHCSKCCKYHPFCDREIRWTSKKTSCLKVVFQRNLRGKHRSLRYGMANVKDRDKKAHRRQWWPNCRDEYKPRPAPPPYRRPRPRPAPRPRPPPPPREVTENFNDLHGTIRSPNYPGYPSNLEYTYIIELPEKNKRIQLTFRVVDLPRRENGDCKKDYIEIYDGITTWSTVTKTICGNESIYQPIISKSYKMKVKFIADRVKGKNRGFDATYDPYQPPRVTNVSQKVTGVVIGTACGLVFLVLTFLAICHSRRLAVLRRHYDDQSLNGNDAIEEKAPPTYYDVMNSPENYPLTPPSSKRKEHHLAGTPQNEALPRYQDLFPLAEPGQEVQSSDVASHMSRDVEGVQLTREIKGNDVNESEDRDVRDIDSGSDVGESGDRENDVSENDDKGVDARRESDARRGSDVKRGSDVRRESDVRRGSDVKPERDVGEGDDVRQGSDVKIAMGEFNVDAGGVKREDGSDTVAYQEYSRAITTDV